MPDTVASLCLVLAVFLLAGAVKGIVGLGLPTIAMGLMGTWMAPADAAALLLLPSLVTNLQQLCGGRHLRRVLVRFWPMAACIAAGTWLGAGVIVRADARPASLGLGAALALYALIGLGRWRPTVPARAQAWAGPLAGGLSGLLTGATGVFVLPAVPYLNALSLEPDELMQALGLCFTVSTLALAASLAWHGALDATATLPSALALAPALAGMAIGTRLRRRIGGDAFRRLFFGTLFGLGLEILWRALR